MEPNADGQTFSTHGHKFIAQIVQSIGNFDSGLPYYRILSKHDGEKIVIVFHLYTGLIHYDTSHMSEWFFF